MTLCYIGPENNPFKETADDFLNHPEHYEVPSSVLTAARTGLKNANDEILKIARAEYGIDIKTFTREGVDDFVYTPNVATRESMEESLDGVVNSYTSQGLSVNAGPAKTRVFDGNYDRWVADNSYKAETGLDETFAAHDAAIARMAGNATYKEGVGGLTKLEVMQKVHPKLYDQMIALRKTVQGLQGMKGRLSKRTQGAIDEFLADQDGVTLADLSEALDVRIVRGKREGADVAAISAAIKDVKTQIRDLRRRWDAANLEGWQRSQKTSLYHLPEDREVIESLLETRLNMGEGLVSAIDEVRLVAFAGDASPLTIQGFLGMLSNPIVGAQSVKSSLKGILGPDELARILSKEPELVREFAFHTGRPFGQLTAEFRQEGKGLERLPGVAGRGFAALNQGMLNAVEILRYNQWKFDRKLLMMGGKSADVAGAESANILSKIIPALNPAESGKSVLRSRFERIPVISSSFILGPAGFIQNAAVGVARLLVSTRLSPAARWRALDGREQLAILHMASIAGTLATASIGSHIASGWSPQDAVREVLDPNGPRFLNIALGRDRHIPIGGPLRSAVKAFVPRKVGEVEGTPVYLPFAGVPRWAKNKTTPAILRPIRLVMNRDYFGDKIRTGNAIEQVLRTLWYAGNTVLPLTLQDPSEALRTGETTDPLELAERGAVQFLGVDERRTSKRTLAIESAYRDNVINSADYDGVPNAGDLNATDRDILAKLHPDLFGDEADFGPTSAEDLSERQLQRVGGETIGLAVDIKDASMEATRTEAGDSDASEQSTRRSLAEQITGTLKIYGGVLSQRFEQFPSDDSTFSETRRLQVRYRDISDQHNERFTIADRERNEEAWAAFETAIDRAFTQGELDVLEREGAINDSDTERAWHELNAIVGDSQYYELPQGARREAYRRSNPQIDGALWAMGRVSRVMSGLGRDAALSAYQQLYDVRIRPTDVSRGSSGGPRGPSAPSGPSAPRQR